MAIKKIDTIQSAQITILQNDINELKTKLNLLVDDVVAMTPKVNQVIDDLNDMNEVTMAGYTTPGSPVSHGILQSIEDWVNGYDLHQNKFRGIPYIYSGTLYILGQPYNYCGDKLAHLVGTVQDPSGDQVCITRPSYSAKSGGGSSGSGGSSSNPGGTGQGGNTSHTQGSSDASIDGRYGDLSGLLNISTSSANRAKKLARQTLNRLRK